MSCIGSHLGFRIGIKNPNFYGKNVSKRFFSETTWIIETKLPRNNHLKVLLKVWVFYADLKYRNIFFSETIALIEPKPL
jgi:hypothetical protein